MSKMSRPGLIIFTSGLLGSFFYLFLSAVLAWQAFSALVELGFVSAAVLGFLLMGARSGWRQMNATVGSHEAKHLYRFSLLASIGMCCLAADLAFVEISNGVSGTAIWGGIFLVGSVMFLLGIALTLLQKDATKEATTNIRG